MFNAKFHFRKEELDEQAFKLRSVLEAEEVSHVLVDGGLRESRLIDGKPVRGARGRR